ncbi:MAG: PAS domain S-box protein [Anaerolineae bacterium]|nr:MAG: PAS domain S-box protein [Anaerolineae bacterium]
MTETTNRLPSESGDFPYQRIFESAIDGLVLQDIRTGGIVDLNPAACTMHGYERDELLGKPVTVFITPAHHQPFLEQVQRMQAGDELNIRTVHQRRDGSTFHCEWRLSIFDVQGRPTLLGIVRDINNRILAEEGLERRMNARTLEQATLLDISHTLASTLELQPKLILTQLRQIVAYDHAGLFSLQDSSLVTLAMRGAPLLEDRPPIHIRLHDPKTLAALFNEHRPIRIPDIWSDQPDAQSLRGLLDDGAAILLEGMHSWMWVPLAVRGRIIGGVGLAHANRDQFTLHHADLALSVANQAAITMVNAELYGHARELAVLEERQRLARNLHDAVNQSLFSAGLIAEVLPRLWDKDPESARDSLEDLRKLVRGAMSEMRALLAELRPSTLVDAELGDLLRLLTSAFTGRTDIPAAVSVTGTGVLPADVQVAVYRICQEALYNVAKHSHAKNVELILSQEECAFELKLKDNGKGFNPEQLASGHYGLSMMRERAEAAGVQLLIASQPGQGTELTLRWQDGKEGEAA